MRKNRKSRTPLIAPLEDLQIRMRVVRGDYGYAKDIEEIEVSPGNLGRIVEKINEIVEWIKQHQSPAP